MTNAPTTRETADHAELARLAEAASAHLASPNLNADGFGLQIWGDSLKGDDTHVLDVRGWGYLTGGGSGALGLSEGDGIAAQRAIQAYVVAAWNAVPALLSEIAALRGERDDVCARLQIVVHDHAADIQRLRQAERQRDEAVALLSPFAALADKFGCWSVVEVCAPEPGNTSPVIQPMPLSAFENAAAFIANQGADQ